MTVLCFAYGSNMDKQRLEDRVGKIYSEYPAVLGNHVLRFNKLAAGSIEGMGYANIMPSPGSVVEGILYEIDKKGLVKLDGCEACPLHYKRVEMDVGITSTGEIRRAYVYIANDIQLRPGLYPCEEYLGHLLAGKRLLSPGYMEFLKSTPTLESRRKIGA